MSRLKGNRVGLSIFIDMGLSQAKVFEQSMEYEQSIIPSSLQYLFEKPLRTDKYFCLYSQSDFEKSTKEQKRELLEIHNRNIVFLNNN